MLNQFSSFRLPSRIEGTGCNRCDILLAMEHGVLHVDALDRDGRHFLLMCPQHMLGAPCIEKNFASRMWALKPSPVMFWRSFFVCSCCDHKSMETFVLTCEQLWVDLTLVCADWSPAVKDKLEERKKQGLRRAWIAAVVYRGYANLPPPLMP
jgi:hypothetical protein